MPRLPRPKPKPHKTAAPRAEPKPYVVTPNSRFSNVITPGEEHPCILADGTHVSYRSPDERIVLRQIIGDRCETVALSPDEVAGLMEYIRRLVLRLDAA